MIEETLGSYHRTESIINRRYAIKQQDMKNEEENIITTGPNMMRKLNKQMSADDNNEENNAFGTTVITKIPETSSYFPSFDYSKLGMINPHQKEKVMNKDSEWQYWTSSLHPR